VIPANLNAQTAALGIALGLVFSLICYLTTNLSPGG
jgi:gamma-polyglutamate biosynthesis protein CapC